MTRILITGSREWKNDKVMAQVLQATAKSLMHDPNTPWPATLVHGGARGADSMAGRLWIQLGGFVEVHEADWRPAGIYNPYAGHGRNQKMVDLGADACFAFLVSGAGNRGTRDCMRRATKAGIEVMEFWNE